MKFYFLYTLNPIVKTTMKLKTSILLSQVLLISDLLGNMEITHLYLYSFFLNSNTKYSLSRKTVNTEENFWNVYCFATNHM